MSDSKALPPIGTLVVIVPIAHLIVAAMWVWGWATGFGSGVYMLADAKDVFSLSVGDLVSVYLGAIIAPLIMLVFHRPRTSKAPQPTSNSPAVNDPAVLQSRLDGMEEQLRQARATYRRIVFGAKAVGWGALLIVAICTLLIIDAWARGAVIGVAAVGLMVLPVGVMLIRIEDVSKSGFQHWLPVVLIFGLASSAAANGVMTGQVNRYASYEAAGKRRLHCGSAVILRRLGDSYVGVVKGGQKVVTDLECKVVMVAPPTRAIRNREWHLSPFPHVQYHPVK